MNEQTAVIFRVFKDGGGVVALFPELPGGNNPRYCESFQLLGGHCSASPELTRGYTRPATPEEYAAVKRILEGARYGYNLRVLTRTPRNAYQTRAAALQEWGR
jgi:hypothetical protein